MEPLQLGHIDELYNMDTALMRTLNFVYLVLVLERINCMYRRKRNNDVPELRATVADTNALSYRNENQDIFIQLLVSGSQVSKCAL